MKLIRNMLVVMTAMFAIGSASAHDLSLICNGTQARFDDALQKNMAVVNNMRLLARQMPDQDGRDLFNSIASLIESSAKAHQTFRITACGIT